jgi:outer membrane cobalamin receptor
MTTSKSKPVPQAKRFQRSRLMRHLVLASLTSLALPVWAAESFLDFPLEDLLKVEIRSASRKLQRVQDVAAAVSVISREEIERSGARTIPEALRLAPGVEVARIGNNH